MQAEARELHKEASSLKTISCTSDLQCLITFSIFRHNEEASSLIRTLKTVHSTSDAQCVDTSCLFRHNEELEQGSVAMQAEARKLQREANSLARRLEAFMDDKLKDRTSFDAATPIDKTLDYLQNVIMVSACELTLCVKSATQTVSLDRTLKCLQNVIMVCACELTLCMIS